MRGELELTINCEKVAQYVKVIKHYCDKIELEFDKAALQKRWQTNKSETQCSCEASRDFK